jgi:hypothetical protein
MRFFTENSMCASSFRGLSTIKATRLNRLFGQMITENFLRIQSEIISPDMLYLRGCFPDQRGGLCERWLQSIIRRIESQQSQNATTDEDLHLHNSIHQT